MFNQTWHKAAMALDEGGMQVYKNKVPHFFSRVDNYEIVKIH